MLLPDVLRMDLSLLPPNDLVVANNGLQNGRRFGDDAIVLGCCSGARTTTASLGMINDRAKSQIPGLGYTVTYAVGNTLLTVWGMVLVILLT